MDIATLEERLKQPDGYRWMPLSALKAGGHLACIDGRHEESVIATPGGDLGEFILLVSAVEAATGKMFDLEAVERWLAEVMEWHADFYMHTDENALKALSATLRADSRFDDVPGLEEIDRLADFIRAPALRHREALETYLLEPEHNGCGHLRLMLEVPDAYAVRLSVVQMAIRSFYHRMWNGSPSTHYVVLYGQHEESVIVVISLPEEPNSSTYVPAMSGGWLGEEDAFVVHEPARHYLRRENLTLLANAGVIDPSIDTDALELEMDRLAALHLRETASRLAPHLPTFVIEFDEEAHELRVVDEL